MCKSLRFGGGRCAANWNYGGWAVVIIFGLVFIEVIDRSFFDCLCQSQLPDW